MNNKKLELEVNKNKLSNKNYPKHKIKQNFVKIDKK
jgi:hypothetical protein